MYHRHPDVTPRCRRACFHLLVRPSATTSPLPLPGSGASKGGKATHDGREMGRVARFRGAEGGVVDRSRIQMVTSSHSPPFLAQTLGAAQNETRSSGLQISNDSGRRWVMGKSELTFGMGSGHLAPRRNRTNYVEHTSKARVPQYLCKSRRLPPSGLCPSRPSAPGRVVSAAQHAVLPKKPPSTRRHRPSRIPPPCPPTRVPSCTERQNPTQTERVRSPAKPPQILGASPSPRCSRSQQRARQGIRSEGRGDRNGNSMCNANVMGERGVGR